jgi:hypothetical protein
MPHEGDSEHYARKPVEPDSFEWEDCCLDSSHELARRAVKHLAIAVAPGVATQAVGPSALSGTVSD